jgi:hypothetical protein
MLAEAIAKANMNQRFQEAAIVTWPMRRLDQLATVIDTVAAPVLMVAAPVIMVAAPVIMAAVPLVETEGLVVGTPARLAAVIMAKCMAATAAPVMVPVVITVPATVQTPDAVMQAPSRADTTPLAVIMAVQAAVPAATAARATLADTRAFIAPGQRLFLGLDLGQRLEPCDWLVGHAGLRRFPGPIPSPSRHCRRRADRGCARPTHLKKDE